jgi:hypothetical protein
MYSEKSDRQPVTLNPPAVKTTFVGFGRSLPLAEQRQRLKIDAETFSFVYYNDNNDLKSEKNRRDGPSSKLVDIGQSFRVIRERTRLRNRLGLVLSSFSSY